MARYNHFAHIKYEPINFSTVEIGQKFRMGKHRGNRHRYLVMIKTGELSYQELKSKVDHAPHDKNFIVYKY